MCDRKKTKLFVTGGPLHDICVVSSRKFHSLQSALHDTDNPNIYPQLIEIRSSQRAVYRWLVLVTNFGSSFREQKGGRSMGANLKHDQGINSLPPRCVRMPVCRHTAVFLVAFYMQWAYQERSGDSDPLTAVPSPQRCNDCARSGGLSAGMHTGRINYCCRVV